MSETKTCMRCNRNRGVGQFSTSNKLQDGLYPWCKDCLTALRTHRNPVEKAQYLSDYQKSYHASYRKRKFSDATDGMVQAITAGRENSTLIVGLFETQTWRDFKDKVTKTCAVCRGFKDIMLVTVLPVHLYPEYIFADSNYVSLCGKHAAALPDVFSRRAEFLMQFTKFNDVFIKEHEQSLTMLYAAAGERYAKGRPYTP